MSNTAPKDASTFFKKLEKNNNRDWFNENKPKFKAVEAEIKTVYNSVFESLNIHDDIDKLKIFRIYRDVRFSKNKLPYKTHFGGSFHRTKPRLRGGYYLHIQPNNESFIATGFWEPNKEDLLRIRKEFEQDFGKILIQYPFITVKVVIGIYWQAFKLWLKRIPFYDHPKSKV